MTSTLQQEGSRKLNMSASQVMRVAQGLYERGYITYMRTDSTMLSEVAVAAARAQVTELFGQQYLADTPRRWEGKVKNAQEAHEAIRPAGESFRAPAEVSGELSGSDLRLYEMIWMRTLASQMADATGRTVTVRIGATSSSGEDAEFSASGTTITFPGYRRAYVEGSDDPDAELADQERLLPVLEVGQRVPLGALEPKGHTTTPPPRYTEASLVKRLEELGIGRPSTYASIMQTIQDRGYVWKRGGTLVPTWTAFAVVNLLERHFETLVDYAFTARMEDDLDAIARNELAKAEWLTRFYFGNGDPGLKRLVHDNLDLIDAAEINSIPARARCQRRTRRGEARSLRPVCEAGRGHRVGAREPAAGRAHTRPGPRAARRAEVGRPDRNRRRHWASDLRPQRTIRAVRAARRRRHAARRREAEDGVAVQDDDPRAPDAGRGPRTCSRCRVVSAPTRPTVRVSRRATAGTARSCARARSTGRSTPRSTSSPSRSTEALALLASPACTAGGGRRSRRCASSARTRSRGRPMVAKEGRFGTYVTDGETNASLRRGDLLEEITAERAAELLAERREAGPSKPRKTAGKAAKKTDREEDHREEDRREEGRSEEESCEEGGREEPGRRSRVTVA